MIQEKQLMDFVKKILAEKSTAEITPTTLLFKERLLDSMNILDLMGFIEKKLGRKLQDEEIIMKNFQSIEAIMATFFHE